MIARLIAYVRGIARRRRIGAEVDDELRFHVEQEIQAHVARGVPPGEARRMALRDLGGMTQTTEAVREVRTIWLDLLWRDARHAMRSLRATPAFTAVALVVLTLSIGATTAIFSVVDAVILRGLPFDESDRLVAVGELNIKDASSDSLNRVCPAELSRLAGSAGRLYGPGRRRLRRDQPEAGRGRAPGKPPRPAGDRRLLLSAANRSSSRARILHRRRN